MSERVGRLVAIALFAALRVGDAQAPPDRVAEFVATARQATERFKDIDVAIAESYVKVGPDFPAMGVHWVNGELIMKGELNAARPAILTYTTIGGVQTLTGVVYAIALKQGENPPSLPTGAQWHDHVGTVDEESLLFGHHGHHGDDDVRLVVMHAWIWTPNPDGMFATDNWALPLTRIGVKAPDGVSPDAARALSLLAGASAYYSRLIVSVGELDDRESTAVGEILERQRSVVAQWWSERAGGAGDVSAPLSAGEASRLSAVWRQLGREVGQSVSTAASRRLARLWAP